MKSCCMKGKNRDWRFNLGIKNGTLSPRDTSFCDFYLSTALMLFGPATGPSNIRRGLASFIRTVIVDV
jgi:hypothetical protein